jgi:hypothetical protein
MISLSTALRNGMLNNTGMKEAFTNGWMQIFTGPQPASADAAVQGTLLGIVTKAAGAFTPGAATNGINFAAPSGGVVAKDTDAWQMLGVAIGTAGYFRLCGNPADAGSGSDTTHMRMDGSIATSGGDLNLSNVNIVVNTPVTIDTFAFTLPAA